MSSQPVIDQKPATKLVTLQVVQHLAPGGIETMALDLQRFAPDPDHSFIVSLQGNKEQLIQRWPRLAAYTDRIICLDKADGWQWQTVTDLVALFKALKPDVVHTHHIGPLIYGGIAARRAGVKHIVHTEHDAWHLQSVKRRWLERLVLAVVKPILVADAHVVAEVMKQRLNIPLPLVIQNGIDTERFTLGDKAAARAPFGLPADAVVIGCAARLIAVKGHKTLLAAMKQLPEPVHLLLAGHGEEHGALMAYVAEHLDPDRVHFLGNVDDMPRFYQAIDIFCLPSYQEGFPLSPLEAQASGVPVVASDIGGVKETLCPQTGRLVTAGDADQLAQALSMQILTMVQTGCLPLTAKLASFVQNVIEQRGDNQPIDQLVTLHRPSPSIQWQIANDTEDSHCNLPNTIRSFVTGNNDVRQMANSYYQLSR